MILYKLGILSEYAYEAVGLLWAARGFLIHAASYATTDLRQYQEVNDLQAKCCRCLKMIELKLGRIGDNGYMAHFTDTEGNKVAFHSINNSTVVTDGKSRIKLYRYKGVTQPELNSSTNART